MKGSKISLDEYSRWFSEHEIALEFFRELYQLMQTFRIPKNVPRICKHFPV